MLRIEREEHVVLWTIDRPSTKNSLDRSTMEALTQAARDVASSPDVRAAVLTGVGDSFASGGDLRELRGRHSTADAEALCDLGFAMTSAIAEARVPVIAAVAGAAIGGGAELALACDMRIGDTRAMLSFKHARMGVTTAWGSVPRLTSLVGASSAARLLFTGREISASEAHALGLFDEMVDEGEALATALAWAREISHAAPMAVHSMKRLLRASEAATGVRALERQLFIEAWCSEDHIDAVEAYFERRVPRWMAR